MARRLHKELEWIALKAMRKDRTRRYRSASELADDIRNYLEGNPLIAGPETVTYRVQKFVRRNRVLVGAAAAVGAALVLGIVASTWQATVATRARRVAEHRLYAANMNLAQQAWEQNNMGRVRQLLDETAAYPERGFEWYYWQLQTHRARQTLYTGAIRSLAFSPDGQKIVTSGYDQTAKLWDAASGKELLTLKGHDAGVQ